MIELVMMGREAPSQLRAFVLRILVASEGDLEVAADAVDLSALDFHRLLLLVGEEDAPARLRAERRISLPPPTRPFVRWFSKAS